MDTGCARGSSLQLDRVRSVGARPDCRRPSAAALIICAMTRPGQHPLISHVRICGTRPQASSCVVYPGRTRCAQVRPGCMRTVRQSASVHGSSRSNDLCPSTGKRMCRWINQGPRPRSERRIWCVDEDGRQYIQLAYIIALPRTDPVVIVHQYIHGTHIHCWRVHATTQA